MVTTDHRVEFPPLQVVIGIRLHSVWSISRQRPVDRLPVRIERHERLVERAVGVGSITTDPVADVGGGQPAVVAVKAAVSIGKRAVKPPSPLVETELKTVVVAGRLRVIRTAVAVGHYLVQPNSRVRNVVHLAVLGNGAGVFNRPIQALARIPSFKHHRVSQLPVGADHHFVLLHGQQVRIHQAGLT